MNSISIPANEPKLANSPKSIKIKLNGVTQILDKLGFPFDNQSKLASNGVSVEMILIQPNSEYQFENQKNADMTISIINGALEGANGLDDAYNEVCGANEMIYLPVGGAYRARNISDNELVIAVITRSDRLIMN